MRHTASIGVVVLVAFFTSAPARGGQAPPAKLPGSAPKGSPVYGVSGAYTYRTNCATCHGTAGKGDGPLAENLGVRPPDLTLLAKRSQGTYPAEMVYKIIDGRNPLKGHGGPDMPVWGDAFKNVETGYDEARVKEKIRSLVEYLRTLQQK